MDALAKAHWAIVAALIEATGAAVPVPIYAFTPASLAGTPAMKQTALYGAYREPGV